MMETQMSDLLKRLDSTSILGQMPHPSSDRKPFDVAMHITEEERQELIAQRSEAAYRIRELDAELAFYKGFHDGVCKDGTHVVVPKALLDKQEARIRELDGELKKQTIRVSFWKQKSRIALADGTHVIVPVVATEKMVSEGFQMMCGELEKWEVLELYRAMILAAQDEADETE